ncbi:hypothetical protein GCM10018790_12590 [Kitasatospora xanthocidica]|nr:hypothetical protein GCM10018790_12590 [Kitasatospora xanthocidica]
MMPAPTITTSLRPGSPVGCVREAAVAGAGTVLLLMAPDSGLVDLDVKRCLYKLPFVHPLDHHRRRAVVLGNNQVVRLEKFRPQVS